MRISLNHPTQQDFPLFSIINHSLLGTPIYGTPHISFPTFPTSVATSPSPHHRCSLSARPTGRLLRTCEMGLDSVSLRAAVSVALPISMSIFPKLCSVYEYQKLASQYFGQDVVQLGTNVETMSKVMGRLQRRQQELTQGCSITRHAATQCDKVRSESISVQPFNLKSNYLEPGSLKIPRNNP